MSATTDHEGDRFHAALITARRIVSAKYRGLQREDREDLVADTMAKYTKSFPDRGPGPDQPTAWLRRTLQTTFIDRWKAEQARPQHQRGAQEHHAELGGSDDGRDLPFLVNALRMSPSVLSAWRDLAEQLVGRLNAEDRYLFLAKDVDRVPARELAERLGIRISAVEQRASRVRASLRAALEADPELLAELRDGMPQHHQHRPR